ncbi:iron ABC transporter permease [Pseudoclavibacter sp. AY1F1]|uniref:FecCD family ABC transporter permease n=1 Tax=Pseudoclavibacter sp. AY1F1 TaxID=2080583 RepID=UPI002157E539|nr:iron chelate uptake ABC transporter family permease subunit [Pseudoclavibacter sp. AY1F1]
MTTEVKGKAPGSVVRSSGGALRRVSDGRRVSMLLISAIVLALSCAASIAIGSREVPLDQVWAAVTGGQVDQATRTAILDLRVTRTIIGLLVGAGLAVAGAIIQSVTRNPLADPGILGVTSGASFAVALAVAVLGVTNPLGYVWFAFLGAAATTVLVYFLGSGKGGPNPLRLTLAGMAFGAVLSGIIAAIRFSDPERFNALLVWESGSFQLRTLETTLPVAPFVVAGIVLALALGRSLNALALGDDLAHSLGSSVARTRILSIIAITLLAGGATAIAGPIAFVGLMVPHLARAMVGQDQRWIMGLSVLLGPSLVLVADVLGRVVLRPGELPVGIVTAFIGAPVLVALARRKKVSGL